MTNAGMKMVSCYTFTSQWMGMVLTVVVLRLQWVAMGEGRGGELGFLTTNERKEEVRTKR
jgi:hypothetical protein